MTTSEALDDLRSRILACETLLFLKTWEEERWEAELAELALELERGLVVWSITAGPQPPLNGDEAGRQPEAFLEQIAAYPPDHLFLLKDFHPYLDQPRIVRKLRDLAGTLAEQRKALLLLGPVNDVPLELLKAATPIDLPLPDIEDLRTVLSSVLQVERDEPLSITPDEEDHLLRAVQGLTTAEARKALLRALLGKERIDDDVFTLLVSAKRSMVSGSELVEFYDLQEGVSDIGGLDNLKDWIRRRAEAFSPSARAQGLPTPKGVLLLGVQGCGKSLTARAAARLLSFPLVRLDVANLLSSTRGGSEKNMREVLTLVETVAPVVLWLDEIEKGFAGSVGESGQDATMARLVGSFLTWMSEQQSHVFVVATANSVTGLPPEMLRRGRFDELFFIDLPNYEERKEIFGIHLSRRGWKPEMYDVMELAARTDGYSGAEIEQVVVSAMLDAYGQRRVLTQEDLEEARSQTVPLSVTMEEKIFELREWAQQRCRRATPDSRVTQMLEEETRFAEFHLPDDDDAEQPPENWTTLAAHGQINAAIVEYVRSRGHVPFFQLQDAFAPHLEANGDQGLALKSDPNIVLWTGMGQELCETISTLIASKRLYVHPCEPHPYKTAGRLLKLPPLDSLPADRLARPSWLPADLCLLPPAQDGARLARVGRIKLVR